MMWDNYGHGVGWEGWLMFIFMIVFVVAIVIAAVYLARYLAQPKAPQAQVLPPQQMVAAPPSANAAETPLDIVKRRYAAGEIDRDEYLQKLADL